MNAVGEVLRRTVAPVSPAHRRFRRFLADLPLDASALPRPLEAPTASDFIICGSPRTGTSLAAAALFQPPRAVTVMEPWDGMRLPPAELFRSLRAEITSTGRLARGRLDVEALQRDGTVRWGQDGQVVTPPLATEPGYLLGVKWPAYWRYLDLLPDTRFLLCVRDPFDVVASFKHAGGYVARGLQRPIRFNREQNRDLRRATRSAARRRALLYEYTASRTAPLAPRPNVLVVHYERWFSDRDRLLADIGGFLGADLGRSLVRIRPSTKGEQLSPRERALVRTCCPSAELFGYRLADAS